jgi:hypothetical protein
VNEPANRPEYIWSIESIFAFFDQFDELASTPLNTDDGTAVSDRIADFLQLFPASVNVNASAVWYREAAYKDQFDLMADNIKKAKAEKLPIEGMASASVVGQYIKSRCAEFAAMAERASRTNAAITHSLDALRSLLSNIKTDKQISQYANTK